MRTNREIAGMPELRREAHARMLCNGLCARPVELDCLLESTCETCSYFSTGPEFTQSCSAKRGVER